MVAREVTNFLKTSSNLPYKKLETSTKYLNLGPDIFIFFDSRLKPFMIPPLKLEKIPGQYHFFSINFYL